MKIDIIDKRINLEKLNEEIQKYEILFDQKAYLFMNQDTADEISALYHTTYGVTKGSGRIVSYSGNRVYNDEGLKFGEIEIR
jgi:hypothetical protein